MSSLAPDSMPPLPSALLDEVRRDCAALARTRRRRWALFAGLAVTLTLGLGFGMGWRDGALVGAGCGSALHTGLVVALGLGGLGLIGLAFGLTLPAGRRLRGLPVIGLAVGLAVLAAISAAYGAPLDGHSGWACLSIGGACALGLVVLVVGLGRRIIRRHAPSAGLFGVGVGLLALVPLSLACHDASASHLMIWHGLVPVVGGALGLLVWSLARPE